MLLGPILLKISTIGIPDELIFMILATSRSMSDTSSRNLATSLPLYFD